MLTASQSVEDGAHAFLGEVLVIVVVDLDHWRVSAGSEAFDLGQREEAVLGGVALAQAAEFARLQHVVRPAQHARRRAAHLNVETSDRHQVEHGVEGRDLEHLDRRHVELTSDKLHHGKR